MATFAELQTFVNGALIDTPSFVADEVPNLINEAMKELQTLHNFDVMRSVVEYTTGATNTLGARPSDWKEWRGEAYYEDEDGAYHGITFANTRSDALRGSYVHNAGSPWIVVTAEPTDDLGTTSMEIWPVSNELSDFSDGQYRLTLPYWRYLPRLSESDDENWFTNDEHASAFIKYRAVSFGFELNEDNAKADRWNVRAQDKAKLAITANKRRGLSQSDTIAIHTGARSTRVVW